ncbi:hypothetical protein H340_15381 [Streptomyces mobaraensis NBRC 13819 = DSM 40847]|uniref:Uncharacterized protein n=1 Tax=Streptomyces mobaraensis (strain ATCC 29032 / DSM 40847 / JCM 4168 / NBRC 13819 / NCIMB 11159 / IPCR 16-22) TaxID=1223523 RepID=M3A3M7_STRM1|nr:hypothetical protein H340_15381 [Streptomyces mobaraensis NBRC 13819 = DSM 40847]
MELTDQSTGAHVWRVELTPFRRPYLDADGTICVPLWLCRDGEHVTDTDLRLRPSEAVPFREHIGRVLDDAGPVEGRSRA